MLTPKKLLHQGHIFRDNISIMAYYLMKYLYKQYSITTCIKWTSDTRQYYTLNTEKRIKTQLLSDVIKATYLFTRH